MKFIKFLISKTFGINLLIALVVVFLLLVGVIKFLQQYTHQQQKIEVPDLTALNLEEVKIVLADLKLTCEVLEMASYHPKIPKNTVVDQQPEAGMIVKEKRKIYLTINPTGYAKTSVPEFYAKTQKEIVQLIVNSGFKVGSYLEIDDIGTVVRGLTYKGEVLKAGDQLPKMSVIDVVIGNGQLK